MQVIVPLMDIMDSYRKYLKAKLGDEFTQMQSFNKDQEGKEFLDPTVYNKSFVRFASQDETLSKIKEKI